MIRRVTSAALPVFAGLHLAVIAAPAMILAAVARKGGLTGAHGLDLVLISLAIGGVHAAVVWRRLRRELRAGIAFVDAAIAAFDALVALSVLTVGLFFLVLGGFAPEHAAIVNHGWDVIWLWAGVLVAAIGASELVRTAVLRWLGGPRKARSLG